MEVLSTRPTIVYTDDVLVDLSPLSGRVNALLTRQIGNRFDSGLWQNDCNIKVAAFGMDFLELFQKRVIGTWGLNVQELADDILILKLGPPKVQGNTVTGSRTHLKAWAMALKQARVDLQEIVQKSSFSSFTVTDKPDPISRIISSLHLVQDKSRSHGIHIEVLNGVSVTETFILYHELHELFTSSIISSSVFHDGGSRGFNIITSPIGPLTVDEVPAFSYQHLDCVERVESSNLTFPAETLESAIKGACESLIQHEPEITKLDELTGDGDCGTTLLCGAQSVLKILRPSLLQSFPKLLLAITIELEKSMGGTSGGLYCIFLSALASSNAPSIAEALAEATETLLRYTRAREGDRTMLDALIPFVDALKSSSFEEALQRARTGAQATKRLKARLGRATYVGDDRVEGVEDAGAVGVVRLLEGMAKGLKKEV